MGKNFADCHGDHALHYIFQSERYSPVKFEALYLKRSYQIQVYMAQVVAFDCGALMPAVHPPGCLKSPYCQASQARSIWMNQVQTNLRFFGL